MRWWMREMPKCQHEMPDAVFFSNNTDRQWHIRHPSCECEHVTDAHATLVPGFVSEIVIVHATWEAIKSVKVKSRKKKLKHEIHMLRTTRTFLLLEAKAWVSDRIANDVQVIAAINMLQGVCDGKGNHGHA